MLIYRKTLALAVRHVVNPAVVGGVAEAVAGNIAGDLARKLAEKVRTHLTDHSEKLSSALARSHERAWKTIEIALGGDRFWDKFASADDHGLRDQVKAFLASAVMEDDPDYLTACLKELREARDKGHLSAVGGFHPASLADELGPFARYDDPESLLAADCAVVVAIARELKRLGYPRLGRLMEVTPSRGQPLLATAAQFYFRRAVVEDEKLSRELGWVKLIAIDQNVRDGFGFLALILERHGQALEAVLDGQARVELAFGEVRSVMLDLHERVRDLTDEVKLVRQELKPGHSLSYRDDTERELIREVKRRYRALDDDRRRRFPRLGLDLSRLEIVAGDFEEASALAGEAANYLDDPSAKADAYHAQYRAAVELKAWGVALDELKKAAAADPQYILWPSTKYEVDRILGAGAFGVAFLGRHLILDTKAVIKAFDPSGLDRDIAAVFREAHILLHLKHPGIIGLIDCGYADAARRRPYLELEHFADSVTLQDHVERHGPLKPDDLIPIAFQIAEALKAAHLAGVWHRDVKPGNLLIRQVDGHWQVKVIDFGLSIRRSLIQATQARASGLGRTMIGSAVAGTVQYAAPEQLDPKRTGEIGPHSDVFGFGRTCYFALFGEPDPDFHDIARLPKIWSDFLGHCAAKKLDGRLKDFDAVLAELKAIQQPATTVATPPPIVVQPAPPVAALSPKPKSATRDASMLAKLAAIDQAAPTKRKPAPRFTNSLGMTMERIEPGTFQMGITKAQVDHILKLCPNAKREWYDDAQPQHPVKITRPFDLAAHQVTVGQFRQFVDASRYKTTAESSGKGAYGLGGGKWTQDPKVNWRNPGFEQGEDHPVVCVSHDDAMAFIRWLNDQEKPDRRSYALPTEAQWEYACRAGTGGVWGGSDDPESLVRIANIADASLKKVFPAANCIRGDDGFVYTAPVGSFEPNAWRLYDMIGNAWEWCADWHDSGFYKTSPVEDPLGPPQGSSRVSRGGSWRSSAEDCTAACRASRAPGDAYYLIGFRLLAVPLA